MSTIKLSLVFILILGLAAGAFYWYFTYSQSQIDTLEQNNAKLTEAVQIQQQTITAQTQFAVQQNSSLTELQTQLQTANDTKTQLLQKFATGNLNASARKDALALQDKVNAATQAALEALETITGAKLAPAPAESK
jgi:Flp pilus assembly protein TadB